MNSNTKKQARALVAVLLIGIYSLLGSACTKQDGADLVNSAVMSQTQIEQVVTGHFCDSDNVLSNCP